MLSGLEPTFNAVLRASGGGGGSLQPCKPQQAALALFPTLQTTTLVGEIVTSQVKLLTEDT